MQNFHKMPITACKSAYFALNTLIEMKNNTIIL